MNKFNFNNFSNISINQIIFIGVLIRIFLALWNSFITPTLGGSADALRFHELGLQLIDNNGDNQVKPGHLYSVALSYIYFFIDDSLLMGSIVSILAWTISCLFIRASFKELNFDNQNLKLGIIIYTFIPSSVFFTSITLREPFQLLLVNFFLLCIIKIIKYKWLYSIPLIFSVMLLSTLHFGLLIFSLILIYISIFIFCNILLKDLLLISTIIFIFILSIIEIPAGIIYGLDKGFIYAINLYTYGGLATPARTDYKVIPNLNSYDEFISFTIISFIQYMLKPFLWDCTDYKDYLFFIENSLRILLIFLSFINLIELRSNKFHFALQGFFFLSFLILEFVWSLGTMNWGTAARHHVPALGLLVISAFLFRNFSKINNDNIKKNL